MQISSDTRKLYENHIQRKRAALFLALLVTLLAAVLYMGIGSMKLSPADILRVFLGRGAGEIATKFALNQSYGDILTGIILFFIIGSEFFINYEIHFLRSAEKEG